ncbi:ubiquinol-cytochrome-c reductase complex assembly factor hypothetical protein [Limosa lapponica baueri]|uniref:Mitochondrial nucleoid factor 1 n=1 Tax=Limosa lapponica baueri TaxID=1758121 RepID=A0A2I0TIM8_LIMLA|nr:ubiquinol-cytochrome-c reductase complex assembly factor hypothetical protein [Limosa lapponica baueri]
MNISDPETCDRMYESLVRIHTNYYKNKYPRLKDTSFTGVTVEDCKMILATVNSCKPAVSYYYCPDILGPQKAKD